MVKGRVFAPSNEREGIWFQHRGSQNMDFSRSEATSTGRMMSAPFDSRNQQRPPPPPVGFVNKSKVNYGHSNKFSEHDNRHSLQGDGSYFGDGTGSRTLGKQMVVSSMGQHSSGKKLLYSIPHLQEENQPNTSEYTATYLGDNTKLPPVYRRFPQSYSAPKDGRIDTTTSDPFQRNVSAFKTPLHVLAIAQEPLLKPNLFKYSYNGSQQVYPSYTRKDGVLVSNMLNRYGAAYPNVS